MQNRTQSTISDDDDFQLTTSNQNLSTVPTADSDDEFQPVNTSVAAKSRTSTPENSNNGAFLDSNDWNLTCHSPGVLVLGR
jgi:hypothetical protein